MIDTETEFASANVELTVAVPMASNQEQRPVRPKVLHVINGEYYSGAERVQDLLACGLPAEGFEVGFACVKPNRFPETRVSAVPLYETPMKSRFDLRAAWQIAQIIQRDGYSLVHAHTPRSAFMGGIAARISRVPLVYHVHSPTNRDSTNRWRNWLNDANERISLKSAASLIAVSGSLGQHMQSLGYSKDVVKVVANGVPAPEKVRPSDLPDPPWTIGTVALFRPRKGLEVLLDALTLVRKAKLPVRLRAVGPFESPEYERSVRKHVEAASLGEFIDWIGFTDDVPTELAKMDLFVLPSLFGEGLPMVVLEAMAAGVPVVATRVEGVPEAIEHGVSGLLAAAGEAASLADQLQDIVEGRRDWHAIRQSAQQRHAERFSDRAMAAGVARVYCELLE